MSINFQLIIELLLLVIAALTFFGADQWVRTRQFPPMSKREIAGAAFAVLGIIFLVYTEGRVSVLANSATPLPPPSPAVSPTPAFPATNISLMPAYLTGHAGFRANKITNLNLSVVNLGPQLARNVCYVGKIEFLPTPVLSSAEDQIYNEFRNLNPAQSCEDLEVGQSSFGTVGQKITVQMAADLKIGRTAMYLLGHISFQDANGSHDIEQCEWLQAPGDILIWHLCHSHNHVL